MSRGALGGVAVERVEGGGGAGPAPAILYLHGGAYVLASPRVYRPLTSSLARASGAVVHAADYRLAPRHPLPAALDDALACYRALLEDGLEPGRIAIAGDSAGGGLCLATALAIRDRGLPAPAALVAISPWIDLGLTGASIAAKARVEVVLRRGWLRSSARAYRGDAAAEDPRCSPLHADLAGLPPLLVQSAADEVLISDSERLAERARAAGVDVELEVWDDVFHVFQNYPRSLPEAERAIERIAAFLARRWYG